MIIVAIDGEFWKPLFLRYIHLFQQLTLTCE